MPVNCGDESENTSMIESIERSSRNGISENTANPTNGRKEVKSVQKTKFKKWVRKYSAYLILAGIILVSFLVGLLVGSLCFKSNAVSADDVLALPQSTAAAESTLTATPVTFNRPPVVEETLSEVTEPKVYYFDVPLSTELQDYIWETCQTYNVPYELVFAMIQTESGFRTSVISSTNDYGLMQINKVNHEWLKDELGLTDMLDPYQNILAGTYIIGLQLNATDGDPVLALMRYNCGAAGARRLWDQGIYSTAYTDKVMTAYQSYCQLSGK